MKRLALLSLTLLTLSACADRVRHNCESTTGNGFLESKCQ